MKEEEPTSQKETQTYKNVDGWEVKKKKLDTTGMNQESNRKQAGMFYVQHIV